MYQEVVTAGTAVGFPLLPFLPSIRDREKRANAATTTTTTTMSSVYRTRETERWRQQHDALVYRHGGELLFDGMAPPPMSEFADPAPKRERRRSTQPHRAPLLFRRLGVKNQPVDPADEQWEGIENSRESRPLAHQMAVGFLPKAATFRMFRADQSRTVESTDTDDTTIPTVHRREIAEDTLATMHRLREQAARRPARRVQFRETRDPLGPESLDEAQQIAWSEEMGSRARRAEQTNAQRRATRRPAQRDRENPMLFVPAVPQTLPDRQMDTRRPKRDRSAILPLEIGLPYVRPPSPRTTIMADLPPEHPAKRKYHHRRLHTPPPDPFPIVAPPRMEPRPPYSGKVGGTKRRPQFGTFAANGPSPPPGLRECPDPYYTSNPGAYRVHDPFARPVLSYE